MDAMIGNACLRIVREMAKMQGRGVFIADLHVTRTWLPPTNCDPPLHFPKDAIIILLWIPGHFLLSVRTLHHAEDQRRVSSDLISFITQDKGLLLHLEAIIAGKVSSTWASSKGRVNIFFEEDEQLDKVMGFLTSLVEAQTTRCHNQVAFTMDVLLPEATIHALSAVHKC
ncbi:transcript variant X1 [Nothobranchius furzeri]|uniref:Transcript variant X1 n=1 Tax=Nothobranchius furzeri TaxID=105023 RepID=A0A9D3BC11_NOTFU|nr:transcript variant X1 [Nothobranchius furzeri]